MCVCMYVVMEDNEKETRTTKVCKPGSWALFLRLLVYSLDSDSFYSLPLRKCLLW